MDYLKRERKAAKMMGTDSALYVILPIPRAMLFFIDPYPDATAYGVARVFLTLWASTSIVEPILLLTFKEKYREEIKKIFTWAHLSVKNKFTISNLTLTTSAKQ